MRYSLLTIALFVTAAWGLDAQVTLESFEGGANLTWVAGNGTYNGVVDNPEDTTGINPSMQVGSYTKSGEHGFSLFYADLAEPLDLSVNNEFSIQIYAGAATQILLKLEGDGEAIEATKNIATDSVWRTYTFDFSAAADFTTIDRIILFFDPGVTESADTYLFDNLIASPAGPCAGTVPDPTIIDDFECQRNATYAVPGFNDIRAVDNPDPSGINTSDRVGEYTDREGGFHAMVISYNSPIDLSTNNYICMKVWAPVAGNLLFKLEGVSPAVETPVAIDETNTWVEACVDFSAAAGASYTRLVFFFNAGVADADGDIYYIDDITRTPPPAAEALEDFEDGANLTWEPLNNDNAQHGTFNGVIDNPDQTEPNTSTRVGSYTRGMSNFSTLTAALPNGIDLSGNPQLNLDVWAPAGATNVTLQLQSPSEGSKSVDAALAGTESWQTLSFNFAEFDGITDFDRVNILFAPQTMGTGTYYFDNLSQGVSTVDPCADVEPDPSVLDDFECQRNVTYTVGADQLTAIDNPDVTNANSSTKVGEFRDGPGAFEALVIDFGGPVDLSVNNQLSVQVWSPAIVPLLFKWEGGSGPVVEEFVDVAATNEWVTYNIDFSDLADTDFTRLVLFFNAGNETAGDELYYFDNLQLNRAPYRNDCVANFESPELTISNWRYFANGALEGNAFIISDNPAPTDLNPSAKVGTFEEANDGAQFAGMFGDPAAPIVMAAGEKTMSMKIWMPVAGDVVFKLERGLDGAPGSGDIFAAYTTPGEWQELTWDFSMTAGGAPIPDGAQYERITLIPNFGVIPEENLTHYFDDIVVGNGSCATTGIFEPVRVADLRVFPNPAYDRLTIENSDQATTFRVTNLLGQTFETVRTDGARERLDLDLSRLPKGMYILTAYDATGQLTAKANFVKQ